LIAVNAAKAPFSESTNVDEALPVTEVMNPTLIVDAVTPVSVAPPLDPPEVVVAEPDVVALPAPDVVAEPPPDVVLLEVLLLLEQPAASNAIIPAVNATAMCLRFIT
jgi:hypothetical protein